ncbi:unnamed protein product, partial [Pocillopora meandrina]
GSTFLLIRSYDEARNLFALFLTINLFLILFALIVNASICYIMIRGKRYKRNRSNLFITHLSVMELIYRFLIFPLLVYLAVPSSGIQSFHCKVASFFSSTSASAIFVSLVAIAADRYHNILHPLENLKSKRKPTLLLSAVWVYSAVVSIPVVVSARAVPVLEIPEAREMTCDNCAHEKLCDIPQNSLGRSSTTFYFLLAFFIPLAVIFWLYTKVAIFLYRRGKNGMMHKVKARSKSKAVRMLTITVIGYVLSLGPYVVVAMLRSYGIFNETPFGIMFLINGLVDFAYHTSSLGNPLIYSYYNGNFRNEIVRLSSGIQSFQCKVVSFFSHVSASAIFISLVAIAADRYQNIVHPLANLKSNRKPSLLLIVVWVYATVVSIPTVFSVKAVPASEIPEAKGMTCDADCAGKKLCEIPQNSLGRFSTTLYFLLAFVIQLVVIFIFYNKIAIFLHNRGKNGMMHKVAVRSTSKAIRMLIITVLGYMISLGPRVVVAVLRSYGIFNGTSFAAMFLFHALVDFASYSSSMGNPLIYSYYNGDFRKEIVRVCRRKKKKKLPHMQ